MTRYLAGVDLSRYNGEPTTTGLSFAFVRATYGTAVDPRYARHVAWLRSHGLIVGAYHFGVGGAQDPIGAQVERFLEASKGAGLLALDLETNTSHAPTMTRAEAVGFVSRVHAAGHAIGLYHSRSSFPRIGQDWNWIAQWGDRPPTGLPWTFWQYQGAPLDRDYFHGNAAQLAALVELTHHRQVTQ